MRRIVIAACVAAAFQSGAAHAQTLYKCASRTGHSYQQSPCVGASRTLDTMVTVPEPPPSAAQLAQRARKAELDRTESAFLSHLAGTDQMPSSYRGSRYARSAARIERNPGNDECRLARATRKTTLRTVGFNRTFDLLRRLDDEVRTACGWG